MAQKTKLTKEGKERLEAEYRELIEVTRDEVKKQLAEARAQGDLSENADYDAARNRQAQVEARIKEIENILANAEIIEEDNKKKKGKVGFGSKVTIKFLANGKEATYLIVGTVESNPFNNKISGDSPLGAALLGKSVGDIVEVKVKDKVPYQVEIVKIGE